MLIPPAKFDEAMKNIDQTMIIAIRPPTVDDSYYAELEKLEQEQIQKLGQDPPNASAADLPFVETPISSALPASE